MPPSNRCHTRKQHCDMYSRKYNSYHNHNIRNSCVHMKCTQTKQIHTLTIAHTYFDVRMKKTHARTHLDELQLSIYTPPWGGSSTHTHARTHTHMYLCAHKMNILKRVARVKKCKSHESTIIMTNEHGSGLYSHAIHTCIHQSS